MTVEDLVYKAGGYTKNANVNKLMINNEILKDNYNKIKINNASELMWNIIYEADQK